MKLNENIDQAKARWQAWLDGKLTKGPIVAVTAPLERPREALPPPAKPASAAERKLSVEYFVASARRGVLSTWYGGDAIPSVFVNYGPGAVAAYIGGRYEIDERTVWFGGFPQSDELQYILDHVAYDAGNAYWRTTLAATRALLADAAGQYYVSYTDLGGAMDILASFRTPEELLMDMIESPELVQRCEERICDLFLQYFRELTAVFAAAGQDGHTCWLPCYSKRPWYSLQCDLSVMFSTAMFREFVVPRLARMAAAGGNAIYHWDGPEQLQHVEAVCSVPGINALEYVAVVGRDEPNASAYYLPWYRKAAEAGRGILIRSARPDLALELSKKMPAEKLAVIFTARSVQEGEEILKMFR